VNLLVSEQYIDSIMHGATKEKACVVYVIIIEYLNITQDIISYSRVRKLRKAPTGFVMYLCLSVLLCAIIEQRYNFS